jgi:hypothetical protein
MFDYRQDNKGTEMGVNVVTGTVSNLREATHTEGRIGQHAVGGTVTGKVSSKQVYSFRVDNRPVTYESKEMLSLSDGDHVACAGPLGGGVIKAMKVRNDSTGVIYGHSPMLVLLGMICVLLASLMLIGTGVGAILGVPVFFVALYGLYKTWQLFQSAKAVEAVPVQRTA